LGGCWSDTEEKRLGRFGRTSLFCLQDGEIGLRGCWGDTEEKFLRSFGRTSSFCLQDGGIGLGGCWSDTDEIFLGRFGRTSWFYLQDGGIGGSDTEQKFKFIIFNYAERRGDPPAVFGNPCAPILFKFQRTRCV
jgi:hypothetical protein